MTRSSITDCDLYLNSVGMALTSEEAFSQFKQLPGIKDAVERLKPSRGEEYRAIVLRQSPHLLAHLDRFRENDAIGAPDIAPYPEGLMSPTTWRYIKVLGDLEMLFGSLDGWHIAEIGVGYGGQCKILHDRYDIASYTMFDLDPVLQLARKYLDRVGSRAVAGLRLADFRRLAVDESRPYDLVISNWALSECATPVQDDYIDYVLRRSARGYITYNQISHLDGIDSYRRRQFVERLGLESTITAEGLKVDLPPEMDNFLLYWPPRPRLASV